MPVALVSEGAVIASLGLKIFSIVLWSSLDPRNKSEDDSGESDDDSGVVKDDQD